MTARDELIGRRFPVLDDGSVTLRAVLGSDAEICADARISTGSGAASPAEDRRLLRYLFRRRELSPLEQATLKFHLRLPIFVARQLNRYRTAKLQEYSQRYRPAIDAAQRTSEDGWRLQSEDNKQGSAGFLKASGEAGAELPSGWNLTCRESELHALSRRVYQERLSVGVAREQARKDLPLSTYTEWVWSIDLRNLFHVLAERWPGHGAQSEIADYAAVIGNEIVAPLFPLSWEAFNDYQLGAVTLSAIDQRVARSLAAGELFDEACRHEGLDNKRERDECRAKLFGLGFPVDGD